MYTHTCTNTKTCIEDLVVRYTTCCHVLGFLSLVGNDGDLPRLLFATMSFAVVMGTKKYIGVTSLPFNINSCHLKFQQERRLRPSPCSVVPNPFLSLKQLTTYLFICFSVYLTNRCIVSSQIFVGIPIFNSLSTTVCTNFQWPCLFSKCVFREQKKVMFTE